jgi:hypothetical protein
MKVILKTILALVVVGALTFSCSKDDSSDTSSQFTETPTAIKKFDSSNFGTYKGVFVGSTGTIVININEDNTKTAVLIIDGVEYTYTTIGNIINGQATSGLIFKNGDSSFEFNVGASGEEANITNIAIVGHPNAGIEIEKEKSDKIIKCYAGFSDPNTNVANVFNFYTFDGKLVGIAHNDAGVPLLVIGTVSNNSFMGVVDTDEATIEGTIVGDNVKGSYTNKAKETGGIICKRVL